jgi:TolA-binding protein
VDPQPPADPSATPPAIPPATPPATPPAPGAPAAPPATPPATPPAEPPPVDVLLGQIRDLRDENAQRRVALREAQERHTGEIGTLQTQMAERDTRINELLAQLQSREAALEGELNRRLEQVPEAMRGLVKGATVEERLNHLAEMQAAGLFGATLPRNPELPGTSPRTPETGPKSYEEMLNWDTKKFAEFQKAYPARFKELQDQHFGR